MFGVPGVAQFRLSCCRGVLYYANERVLAAVEVGIANAEVMEAAGEVTHDHAHGSRKASLRA
jgi:hypothetical protein